MGALRARLAEDEAQRRATEARHHEEAKKGVKMTAAPGSGVSFKQGDAFSLTLRARMQLLFESTTPTPRAVRAGQADETDMGFQVRRLRLVFMGNAFTPKLTYYIQLGLSNRDTEADLRLVPRDAYLDYAPLRDLHLRGGQMKVPFGKQRVVSSSALQMVDRSTVTGELNLDRDVGVYLWSPDLGGLGKLQYWAGVFGGEGRNRLASTAGGLFFARAQLTPLGLYDDLVEADVERHDKPKASIAASVAYNQDTNRQRSTLGNTYALGEFSYLHAGADAQLKVRGFSVQSELFYRKADEDRLRDPKGAAKDEYSRSAWGYYAQAGYIFPVPFELSGRFGEYRPIGATDPTLKLFREAGGALSYYFAKHSLKAQADYFFLFGDDTRAERHQIRFQVQLFL